MTGQRRRHPRATIAAVIVGFLIIPAAILAIAGPGASEQATATRGPIQDLCQGPVDPNAVGQVPALPVIAEIHNGPSAACLLAGPAPAGLTYVNLCRTIDGDTFADSTTGTVGPPIDDDLSVIAGGGTSSEYPDRLYAGRAGPTVTRVEATLASGGTVEATMAGRWYLIWTRTADNVVRITAYDTAGAMLRRLEDPNGLMPPR
jgi:hypothetical protein